MAAGPSRRTALFSQALARLEARRRVGIINGVGGGLEGAGPRPPAEGRRCLRNGDEPIRVVHFEGIESARRDKGAAQTRSREKESRSPHMTIAFSFGTIGRADRFNTWR